jgi:hypothetical protein
MKFLAFRSVPSPVQPGPIYIALWPLLLLSPDGRQPLVLTRTQTKRTDEKDRADREFLRFF